MISGDQMANESLSSLTYPWLAETAGTAARSQLDRGTAGLGVRFARWGTRARRDVRDADWGSPAEIGPPSPRSSGFGERGGIAVHTPRLSRTRVPCQEANKPQRLALQQQRNHG